jgi:hypothetical protein
MKRLRSCDSCARHVFVSEQVCPFCLSELAPAADPAPLAIPSGASRAQRLALVAALGTQSLLACADSREPVAVPVYGAPLAGNAAPGPAGNAAPTPAAGRGATPPVAVPVYGAPAPLAGQPAPPVAGRGAVPDGGVAMPVYGAPIAGQPAGEDDAGVEPAAGAGGRGGMAVPVYGAPIPEYGAPPPPKD